MQIYWEPPPYTINLGSMATTCNLTIKTKTKNKKKNQRETEKGEHQQSAVLFHQLNDVIWNKQIVIWLGVLLVGLLFPVNPHPTPRLACSILSGLTWMLTNFLSAFSMIEKWSLKIFILVSHVTIFLYYKEDSYWLKIICKEKRNK